MNLDYLGQPAHFFIPGRYDEARDNWQPAPACPPDTAAFATEVDRVRGQQAARRADLATSADLHEEGVDTGRVEHFMRALGLPVAPYVLLRDGFEESPDLLERTTNTSYQKLGAEAVDGFFSHDMDMAIVNRAADSAAELVLVHELTHGAGMKTTILDTGKYEIARVGMSPFRSPPYMPRIGSFIEEARAELVATNYHDQFYPCEQRIASVNGFTLPSKYCRRSDTVAGSHVLMNAFPAIALEVMNSKDNRIIPALLESCVSVQGLRDFARHVNGLQPGMYSYLQHLPADNESKVWGLRHVVNELYDGRKSVTRSVGQQASRAFFAAKIAAYEARTGISLSLAVGERPQR